MFARLSMTPMRFLMFEGNGPRRICEVDHMWDNPITLRRCHKSFEEKWVGDSDKKVLWQLFLPGKEFRLHGDIGLASSSIRNWREQIN